MQPKIHERYFFYGLLFIVGILAVLIFRPFLTVIAVGASLAVVFYPLYEKIRIHMPKKASWAASLLTVLIFIVILFGPLFLIGSIVFQQSQDLYHSITQEGVADGFLAQFNASINGILPSGFDLNLSQKFGDLIGSVTTNVAKIFTSTLHTVFSLLLVILSLFYFLKDGEHWRKNVVMLSPLSDNNDEKILNKLSLAINGVIKGYLLIALVQGVLMGVGLAFFGVPNAAIWGVLAGIASLVPTIGTALVSIPAVIYLFATGDTPNAIGMAIWATVLVGSIDNMLSPIVVGRKVDVPPLLILFAVLGGIALMGPVGILIGPLVISLLYVLLGIYRNEFQS